MNDPKLKWVQGGDALNVGSGGWRLYAGRWLVGSVYYGIGTRKGIDEVWVAACRLPGIKETLGKFVTVNEAKAKVEKGVGVWFAHLGSEPRAPGAPSKEAP